MRFYLLRAPVPLSPLSRWQAPLCRVALVAAALGAASAGLSGLPVLADDAADSALTKTALTNTALTNTALAPRRLLHGTTRTYKNSGHLAGIEMKAVTPLLAAKTPLARFTNRSEAAGSKADFDQFIKEWRTDLKDMARNGVKSPGAYSYDDHAALTFYQPEKLICLRHESYRYLGGAHGVENVAPACYGIKNGKPARLKLADFFRPGTAYRPRVEQLLMAGLKANPNAEWVKDGTVTFLTAAQLNNFQAEPGGLRWWFNPYEAGSYAVGYLEVKLTARELGPGFRSELVSNR